MTHRALVAIVIAVAIAAAGVAASGTQGGEEHQPSLLVVPPVKAGDQGNYTSEGHELRFRFAQAPWIAADGAIHEGLALAQERTDISVFVSYMTGRPIEHPSRLRVWLDGDTFSTGMQNIGGGGSAAGVANVADPAERGIFKNWTYELFETRYDASVAPMCGLVHSLQGQAITPHATLTAPGCGSMTLDAGAKDGDGADSGQTTAWFYGDGVRLELDARFSVPATIVAGGKTWSLDSFENGGGPIQASSSKTRPALEYTTGVLPDESGIEHPFPLSVALSQALGPVPNTLSDFLAEDGAYLAQADFLETVQGGERRRVWTLTASDGAQAVAVTVTQESGPGDEPDAGLPVQGPVAPLATIADATAAARPYPTSDRTEFPFARLASFADRWETTASNHSRAAGFSGWGFAVVCGDTCADARTQTWMGVDERRAVLTCQGLSREGACQYLDFVVIQDRVTVDDTGHLLLRKSSDWSMRDQVAIDYQGIVLQHGGNHSGFASGAGQFAGAPQWGFPSAATTASLTLLGILSGLAYYLWPSIKEGALAFLRTTQAPPENAIRIEVRHAIEASPGIHFHALRRTTSKAAGTLRHHLRVLEETGEIVAHQQGGYKCYFPARGTSRHLIAGAGALKAPSARRMLHGIVQAGHLSMGEAAVFAGLTPSTATHHALRLEDAGLVTRIRAGRTIELRPTGAAAAALDLAGPA